MSVSQQSYVLGSDGEGTLLTIKESSFFINTETQRLRDFFLFSLSLCVSVFKNMGSLILWGDQFDITKLCPCTLRVRLIGNEVRYVEGTVLDERLREGVFLDLGWGATAHSDCHQTGAVIKGISTYLLHAVGDFYLVKSDATGECLVTDFLY